ncbi:helix-turn-helix domain-containing protein [Nocardia sp. CC201C]|uniref:helix-turn-helix domain-containing protein n=1 Tax=Nocardia sp. CC201C TaxID=3044575 RepID=UPI0024A8157B|nr:helix-turn-helix domain-containing protein [Nocardia sp. CC201C]
MTGQPSGQHRDHMTTPWPPPDSANGHADAQGGRADARGGHGVDGPVTAPGAAHGRVVAWAGFVFGSVTSIAANVLHAWLPADTMPPGWTPGIAPQIGAAIWPIGLLLSVEVLSRARWRRGGLWALARYGGAGTVALGSAVISYGHVRDVLLAWGYGPLGASVGPLTLDGLMVISGFALLSMTAADTTSTTVTEPRTALNTAVAAAITGPTQSDPTVSALEGLTTSVAAGADPIVSPVSEQANTDVEGEDGGADTRRARAHELHARGWSHGRIAADLQVSKRTVRRYLATPADTGHDSARAVSTPDRSGPASSVPEISTNHHQPLEGVLA